MMDKMLDLKTIQKICTGYCVGDYLSIEKDMEGVLNVNYILNTTQGKYFIKSIREKAKNKLDMIYGVESFMKEEGIPAITMLKTKADSIFISEDSEIYTLYSFIENVRKSTYSESEYFSIGEMLGKIHKIGKGSIPASIQLKQFNKPSNEVVEEKLLKYKNDILNKDIQDGIDKLFLKYINFKLNIISKIDKVILPNDTLTHGDYHTGNILMDENGIIIGICDWEKTEYAPRAYELARSLIYNCYREGYVLETALAQSKSFMDGYLSQVSMDKKGIMEGCKMRVYHTALSTWIEEKYYERNDDRANKFIQQEIDMLDSIVNKNLLEKIETIFKTI
jgi:Ser/Thr protein kinase RdoA (MazF antagonist)